MSERTTPGGPAYEFSVGDWLVAPRGNRMAGPEGEVRLEPKVMQVLECLAAKPGRTVTKEEFMEEVWTGTIVSDDVLARCISELRKVFGDNPRSPDYIETIRKSGYRLIAPVAEPVAAPVAEPSSVPTTPSELDAPDSSRAGGDVIGGWVGPMRACGSPRCCRIVPSPRGRVEPNDDAAEVERGAVEAEEPRRATVPVSAPPAPTLPPRTARPARPLDRAEQRDTFGGSGSRGRRGDRARRWVFCAAGRSRRAARNGAVYQLPRAGGRAGVLAQRGSDRVHVGRGGRRRVRHLRQTARCRDAAPTHRHARRRVEPDVVAGRPAASRSSARPRAGPTPSWSSRRSGGASGRSWNWRTARWRASRGRRTARRSRSPRRRRPPSRSASSSSPPRPSRCAG